MSYILDALRRADAERQHGQVPGLNAQAGVPVAAAPRPRGAGLVWAGVGATALVLLAVMAWWSLRPQAVSPAPAGAAAPQAGLPLATSTQASTPAATTAAMTATAPTPQATAAAAPTLPVVVSAAPASAVPASGAASPPRVEPPQPEARPVPLASLSADQRRDLPSLAVGGAVWSDNVASRFVIFNGQLVHEGESAAPGVMVERIGPKSAVLRWRDLRIEVPF